MSKKIKAKEPKKEPEIVGIPRKLWIKMAEMELEKRKSLECFQSDLWKTCDGCLEILLCDGPISPVMCQAVDEMIKTGMMTGPTKIPFPKIKQETLPVLISCLRAYGLNVKDHKLVIMEKEKEKK